MRVGYELAINISYPTSANGIIVLLKTPTKYRELFPTLLVKTIDFQLVYNFEQTSTVTIFGEHGMMAHNHDRSANQSSRVAISNDSVFNSNRYSTISSVVYITTILPIVCICLMTSQSAVSDPLPSVYVNVPLSTPVYSDHFYPFISHCISMCSLGSENMLIFRLFCLRKMCKNFCHFFTALRKQRNLVPSLFSVSIPSSDVYPLVAD